MLVPHPFDPGRETSTLSGLIAELRRLLDAHGDVPVIRVMEGCNRSVEPSGMFLTTDGSDDPSSKFHRPRLRPGTPRALVLSEDA